MESFRRRLSGIKEELIHGNLRINALSNSATSQGVLNAEVLSNGISQEDSSQELKSAGTNMSQNGGTAVPSQKYWMPDAVATKCYDCEAKFTTFRRRHHCRVCGQIFCSKCCGSYISGESIGCQGSYILSAIVSFLCN